jgi:hypothetical protein
MTPAEQPFYRLGLGKSLTERIRSGNKMHDRVRRDFMDKSFMDKLRIVLGRKGYRDLQAKVGVEGRQAKMRGALQGNSTTAKQLHEMENAAQEVEQVGAIASGIADPSTILGYAGRQVSKLSGMTPRVAEEVLKLAGSKPSYLATQKTGGRPMTPRDLEVFLTRLQSGTAWNRLPKAARDRLLTALLVSEGYLSGRGQE